jgi:putative methyltransferase (TIGR04325 family)
MNRSPICDQGAAFISVQRMAKCGFPCIVRNAGEIVSSLGSAGYEVDDRWPALELVLRMPLLPDRTVPHYSGLYFRRRLER